MEFRQLRHFLEVVKCGSISRASTKLNLSHQAVSKSLAKLEEELGVELFERGPKGVTVSIYGASLERHANLISLESRNAKMEIEALRSGYAGHVTIASGISAACDIVPQAVANLKKRNKDLIITMLMGNFQAMETNLLNGKIDLFVGILPNENVNPSIAFEPLFEDEYQIIARNEHPLTQREPVLLSDLVGQEWIFSQGYLHGRAELIALFESQGLPPPKMAVETDSVEMTRALVARSDFITQLPRHLIKTQQHAKQLIALELQDVNWGSTVSICYRRRGSLPSATKAMIKEIKCVQSTGDYHLLNS